MSDRRERVARAMLRDHLLRWDGTDDGVDEMWAGAVTQQVYLLQADAAIAAMQAEPTEAEVEAARQEYITKLDAYIEAAKANADCQCYARDDYPECVERMYENAGHEAMRAALIAARKEAR